MQLSLSFVRRESAPRTDPRTAKLQAVLVAARRTDFYARRLKGIAAEAGTIEDTVRALPPVPLRMFLDNRERFTRRKTKAAVAFERVRTVPDGWRAKLGFPAEAIAGPQAELAALAERVEEGAVLPARGARRIIAYTRVGERLLSPSVRERLWDAFELPVFEELRGFDGELLAAECEAHEGLHLEAQSAVFEKLDGELVVTSLMGLENPVLRLRTGLAGTIETGACACGGSVARFVPEAVAATRKPPVTEREGRVAAARALTAAAR
jgi:hypothetical protein